VFDGDFYSDTLRLLDLFLSLEHKRLVYFLDWFSFIYAEDLF